MKDAGELLKEKSIFFEKKGKEYGNTYLEFGEVMLKFFPEGINIKTVEDFNKLGIYHMLVHKMMRIANKLFTNGVSIDSIKDLAVYAAMLEEICLQYKNSLE